jgi:hypothetical protein
MVFDEAAYLEANADVRDAISTGRLQSGFQHFISYGVRENRLNWPNTGKPTILFSSSHNRNFFHRLGDLCIAHPTFNALKEKFAGYPAFWITRPEFGELISVEPPISEAGRDCLVIDAAPPHRHASQWLHSNRHPIDFIADTAGVFVESRHRYIEIPIPVENQRAVDRLGLRQPFVVIAAGPCYSGGNWPYADRQKVANQFCRNGVLCVSIGGNDCAPLQGTIDLCNRLSPNQAIAVIKRAALYIGPDTGTTWLACAARETPKICVLDRNRMRDGIIGFQAFLIDRNICDITAQDGPDRCFELGWRHLNNAAQ